MEPLTLQAPAKINLTLRVLGKRDDGFHEIDSLMTLLPGLHDRLHFEPADGFHFECSDPSVGPDDSNLVVRALRAFEQASGMPCPLRVRLEKSIPHGAGLGGGSSDAASTLLGLNQIHGGALDRNTLAGIAATLGSDIPFFLEAGPARALGRGERLVPASAVPALPVLLLKPAFGVATPDAYRRWKGAQALPGIPDDPQEVDGLTLLNDLERPVFAKHRFLAELKLWLLQRPECRAAQMCGSGSTFFAVLHPGVDAEALTDAARRELDPSLWHWAGSTLGSQE